MNREVYLWIVFFVVVAAVALFIRFYYQPALEISVSAPSNFSAGTVYQFQKVQVPIIVKNTGSAPIENMNLGFYVNGNNTEIYKVTLPKGSSTTILYNYTPGSAGTYNVSVIADPDKLYNIGNRQTSRYSLTLTVLNTSAAEPYSLLPNYYSSYGSYDLNSYGAVLAPYFYTNFSMARVEISQIASANNLLYPLFELVGKYIDHVSAAYAGYSDGSVYSIWISGYIAPNLIDEAALARNLPTANYTISGKQVTFVSLDNQTGMCSWESGGWTKILIANRSLNCTKILTLNSSSLVQAAVPSSLITVLPNDTGVSIGNFTAQNGNVYEAGRLFLLNGSSVLAYAETNNTGSNNVCNGVITVQNGTNYCSTYFSPRPYDIGPYSLVATKKFVGQLNASVFSFINSSAVNQQIQSNIGILSTYRLNSTSRFFIPGFFDACEFNATIGCSNVTFSNSTIGLDIRDNFSEALTLNSISCFEEGPGKTQAINVTIQPNESTHIGDLACYNMNGSITGIPLNLYLNLPLNYTLLNSTSTAGGAAYIV